MFARVSVLVLSVLLVSWLPASGWKTYEGPIEQPGRDRQCNLQGDPCFCIPLDATWQVVDFSGASGCNGPASPTDPCRRNDDDYSFVVPLGFTFDLYGTSQTEVYINNNGNLSFDGGYCTFTSTGFPVADFPMVAPFWADVDTRSPADSCGVVWMKAGPNYLAVAYDHGGYYSQLTDLLNTFQVIISDGTYEPMGLGNNVCFCYGDMQWTTGGASGGVGGFGGVPATVGVNKGDGIDYFQIGLFDQPGTAYDGPGGSNDGVDWLDCQTLCFFVGGEFNEPPVPVNFPLGNTIEVISGGTLNLTVGFIGPEADQTVHTDVADGGLANFGYVSTDGNPSTVDMTFTPEESQVGPHVIHFTATDSYVPPGVTETDLTLVVTPYSPVEDKSWGTIKALYR